MKHQGTTTLETERLILRRYKQTDAEDMYANWASDPEVTKYLMWQTHSDVEVSRSYIESVISEYSNLELYQWGIELKELGQVIGGISVVHLNNDVGSAHIGYCIGRPWWNRGITSEALSAVIKYLMDEVGVNRIESRHDSRNPNSGKVMEACGLTYEGTLKESDVNNQGICDASWYALLRSEYYSQ